MQVHQTLEAPLVSPLSIQGTQPATKAMPSIALDGTTRKWSWKRLALHAAQVAGMALMSGSKRRSNRWQLIALAGGALIAGVATLISKRSRDKAAN